VKTGRPLRVLALNAGSSSLKAAVYRLGEDAETLEVSAKLDRIGQQAGAFRVLDGAGTVLHSEEPRLADHDSAIQKLLDWIKKSEIGALDVAAHRIVYGGARYVQPALVTPQLLADLESMVPLDPDHLPQEIAAIRAVARFDRNLAQSASFDSAFHRHMPKEARTYAIPRNLSEEGIIRYGFHGISYEFVLQELRKEAGDAAANGRVIIAHLGNGASMAAIRQGRCVDTSMGFTPAAGLVMSSRTGDIDPGILLYMAAEKGFDVDRLNDLVNRQSGLLGVSGLTSDMQELLKHESDDEHAAEAVALFCYVAKKFIGAFAAVLGGLDTLVFTAGIGENAPRIRQLICQGLGFLGVYLDEMRNTSNSPVISTDGSPVCLRIIPTNEELMLARHAREVIRRTTPVSISGT
jgi:acetate kinase